MIQFNRSTIKSICKIGMMVCFSCTATNSLAVNDSQLVNHFTDLSIEELMAIDITLATKTHNNAQSVPGMISIIDGVRLQNQGFSTVWDAIAALPGVQTSIDATGQRILVIRGVGKTFSSGKVKLLLNGIAMNTTTTATANTLLNLPVQQVARIELIRGPGSAVHGEFAYVGVINIVTEKDGNRVFAGIDQHHSGTGGLLLSHRDNEENLDISLSISGFETRGESLEAGFDAGQSIGEPGYSPGSVNNPEQTRTVLFDLSYDHFDFSAQWLQARRGDFFGINDLLPPPEKGLRITNSDLALHAGFHHNYDERLKMNFAVNWLRSKTAKHFQFVGTAPGLGFGGAVSDPDAFSNTILTEERLEAILSHTYQLSRKHTLFAELSTVRIEVIDAAQYLNLDPASLLTTRTYVEFPNPVSRDASRRIYSATLQDEYKIRDRLILTAGLRYDHYDDVGSNLAPRLALVQHLDAKNTFRAQYASSFRPPTFLETGGAIAGDISPETIDTIELGHSFQNIDTELKSSLFYSRLDDLIVFRDISPFGFANITRATMKGLELELRHRFDRTWSMTSNLSVLSTREAGSGQALPGTAKLMANLDIDYRLSGTTSINSHFNYIGKRQRESGDSRPALDEDLLANLTVTFGEVADIHGLVIRAGVKNLFASDVRLQSGLGTYADDYPFYRGRNWWLTASYRY